MAYEPEYETWWSDVGKKLCGEDNKATHYYAYKEGAFIALMRSFKEWAEAKENE
jgi:hypothetical protein